MRRERFFPEQKVYLLDGGMGSLLQKKGLPPGKAAEYMNLYHPDKVREAHQAYLEAGSDLIQTNTFGGNPVTLKRNGLDSLAKEVNVKAGELAIEAVKSGGEGKATAVGSIGPTGELLYPLGDLDQDQAEAAYVEQCQALQAAGIELVNIETMSDLRELKAAVMAAKKCGLGVMAEVSFMESGFTLSGASPQVAAATLEGLGVLVAGINCGLGPDGIKPLLKEFAACSSLPLIVQPNAGLPRVVEGKTVYDLTARSFSDLMAGLITETGPLIAGGCCGTTPEHIKALREKPDDPGFSAPVSGEDRQPEDQGVFLAGRAKGLFWTGDWARVKTVEAKALTAESVVVAGKSTDLFGLAQICKDTGAELVRLNLDEWQGASVDLKVFIINAQLYIVAPFSVSGADRELLEVFFRYYIGRPLWENTGFLDKWDNPYIPGVVTVD